MLTFFIDHRKSISSLAAALVSLFFIGVILSLFRWDLQMSQEELGRTILKEMNKLSEDVGRSFENLNASDHKDCDDNLLKLMNQTLFNTRFIKEVGFLENDLLICTSTLGKLTPSYAFKTPPAVTYPDGLNVRINEPLLLFENKITATIIGLKKFNLVIKTDDLAVLLPQKTHWQFLLRSPDNQAIILMQSKQDAPLFHADDKWVVSYSELCVESKRLCITLSSSWSELFIIYQLGFILAIPLILSIFIFSRYLLNRKLYRYTTAAYRIERGLKKANFYMLYQPIVDLNTREIIGCEVLARFKDKIGEIYPDEFIPIIRELEQTWSFTENLLKNTLSDFDDETALPNNFRISFNIFPSDISNQKIAQISDIPFLLNSRFNIVFEVTEDEILEGEKAKQQLSWLNKQSIGIAIDDFGTGYSNLNQIKNFKCQYLKIDRSFVNDMEDGSVKSSLIPHIVEIAHQLNLHIIAEGVENELQANALTQLGVEFGQGWTFGKAMTLQQLSELTQL